ncbi:putative transmembrane protein [Gregarina niphandrodes]|uniref:Transmembrane protein n=1 Tax=Gregarina niphandrodes TaxID=110365 RepID=A0A023B7L4_GRENI|nr:putative transmembrane protein [Gregarina niphandrodes]EZG67455.1 putative transmembrane protein [Gregarina niphandrodes]|eukprot:XP_011130232.1 putative transmembrane protein [Gregarina niphandrodes]
MVNEDEVKTPLTGKRVLPRLFTSENVQLVVLVLAIAGGALACIALLKLLFPGLFWLSVVLVVIITVLVVHRQQSIKYRQRDFGDEESSMYY